VPGQHPAKRQHALELAVPARCCFDQPARQG
jgi:hypothetical protein